MEDQNTEISGNLLECNKEVLNFKLDESLKSIENEVIILKNICSENVGIKIRTNAYKLYQVKPNIAILKPEETLKVEVVAHLGKENDVQSFQHKFLIKGIKVNKDVTINNLNDIFKSLNNLSQYQDIKLLVKNVIPLSTNIQSKLKSEIESEKSSEKVKKEIQKIHKINPQSEIVDQASLVPQKKKQTEENLTSSENNLASEGKTAEYNFIKEETELNNKYNKLKEDYKLLLEENSNYKEKLKNCNVQIKDISYWSSIQLFLEKEKWSTRTLIIVIFISFLLGFIIR